MDQYIFQIPASSHKKHIIQTNIFQNLYDYCQIGSVVQKDMHSGMNSYASTSPRNQHY